MEDGSSTVLKEFVELLSSPETLGASILASADGEKTAQTKVENHGPLLRKACKYLFQRIEKLAETYESLQDNDKEIQLSGLTELYTGSDDEADGDEKKDEEDDVKLDPETIFGQIELQNQPLHKILKKSIKKLSKVAAEGETLENEIRLLEDDVDSESEESDHSAAPEESSEDEGSADEEDSDVDEETKRIRARMERTMAEMDDDEEEDEPAAATLPSATKEEEEESLEDPAAEELNDGFFDINEMEAFADEEEEYLPDDAYGEEKPDADNAEGDKRSFHQKQRDGDIGNDSDASDEDDDDDENDLLFRKVSTVRRRKYRPDDEVDALYGLYKEPSHEDGEDEDENEDFVNMTAADLFGKPNKKYFDKWKSKTNESKSTGTNSRDTNKDDDDSWNDYDFEKERVDDSKTGWPTARDGEASDHEGLPDDDSDEEVPMNDAVDVKKVKGLAGSGQPEKLLRQTEELEKEMLAEKPWQMKGEVASTSRPVNSLLEGTPEFEAATKTAPILTVEHTMNLEDVIKRRILNEDWDDVIPRELPDVGWHLKKGELPEVSQEKSKLGLGELYEREYLKKAVGYDVEAAEKETEEEKAKNEMKTLFANLCSKLDALSNYHFAPRPVADEAEVRVVTKPAIAMEEVLPLHVSEARASAPEEVYGTKRGREGVLTGESELEQADRKRRRASKKAARRKARKQKLADEKLISRLEPGLGLNNPYEKRKAREELSAARATGKVKAGGVDTNDYSASGTFFQRMQAEAERSIRGETERQEEPKKFKKPKSSGFKL